MAELIARYAVCDGPDRKKKERLHYSGCHMKMTALLVLLALAEEPAFSQQIQGSTPTKGVRGSAKGNRRLKPMIASQVGTGEDIITHLADGEGWKTTITIINLSQIRTAVFYLNFYGDDGNSQSFFFEGLGDNTAIQGTLRPGGSIVLETTGVGSLTQGWAQFDTTRTSAFVSGFSVFSNVNGNEAAVPFESDAAGNQILSFDNTGGFGMGVALANSDDLTITVSATFRNENGNVLGTDTFTMDSMTHTSFIFDQQWPFTGGQRGTVYFEPTDTGGTASGLAILGLRFTPDNAYTSVTSLQATTLD